jgi:hypothetical protein
LVVGRWPERGCTVFSRQLSACLKLTVIRSDLFFAQRRRKIVEGPGFLPAQRHFHGRQEPRSLGLPSPRKRGSGRRSGGQLWSCVVGRGRNSFQPFVIPSDLFFAQSAKKDCRGTWVFAGATPLPWAAGTQVPRLALTAQARLGAALGMTVVVVRRGRRSG